MYVSVKESDDIVHSYFSQKQILWGGGGGFQTDQTIHNLTPYDFPVYPKIKVIL